MALARYLGRKLAWTLVVFFVALVLNFYLPRLIPGNPVDAIVGGLARGGGTGGEQLKQVHEHFMKEFGLDKPLWQQFLSMSATCCGATSAPRSASIRRRWAR